MLKILIFLSIKNVLNLYAYGFAKPPSSVFVFFVRQNQYNQYQQTEVGLNQGGSVIKNVSGYVHISAADFIPASSSGPSTLSAFISNL